MCDAFNLFEPLKLHVHQSFDTIMHVHVLIVFQVMKGLTGCECVDVCVQVLKESVRSCVIDAEAVAWDTEKGEILPFQILSTRKRKDANESDIKVQVCVFAFDLLYLNDKVNI